MVGFPHTYSLGIPSMLDTYVGVLLPRTYASLRINLPQALFPCPFSGVLWDRHSSPKYLPGGPERLSELPGVAELKMDLSHVVLAEADAIERTEETAGDRRESGLLPLSVLVK